MIQNQSDSVSEQFLTLGSINGVYGVKGWVKVYSFTSPIENILDYKTWQLSKKNQNKTVRLESGRKHGKGIIAKLEGYDDRDEVVSLLKSEIRIVRALLPALPTGEYYWRDLLGLSVTNLAGVNFGKVDHLFETGANDVVVIKDVSSAKAGTETDTISTGVLESRERLIPFVQGMYIKEIDLLKGTMLVDWPEDFE